MRYVALIQKRNEFGNRHYVTSDGSETKESFIERMKNSYIENARIDWELEIYELGNAIY